MSSSTLQSSKQACSAFPTFAIAARLDYCCRSERSSLPYEVQLWPGAPATPDDEKQQRNTAAAAAAGGTTDCCTAGAQSRCDNPPRIKPNRLELRFTTYQVFLFCTAPAHTAQQYRKNNEKINQQRQQGVSDLGHLALLFHRGGTPWTGATDGRGGHQQAVQFSGSWVQIWSRAGVVVRQPREVETIIFNFPPTRPDR